MPAPPAALIESLSSAAFQSAGLGGRDAPGLAKATAETTAQALDLFMAMAMVLPGIPTAVDPVSGAGVTAGPGTLLPPPAGGPAAVQLESLALANLQAAGVRGQDAPALAKVIAGAVAQGLAMFCAQVKVAPGVAIAGFTTTAPGSLI